MIGGPTAFRPVFLGAYGRPPAQLTRMVGQTAARRVGSPRTEPMEADDGRWHERSAAFLREGHTHDSR
jgi:hypothetical protein